MMLELNFTIHLNGTKCKTIVFVIIRAVEKVSWSPLDADGCTRIPNSLFAQVVNRRDICLSMFHLLVSYVSGDTRAMLMW